MMLASRGVCSSCCRVTFPLRCLSSSSPSFLPRPSSPSSALRFSLYNPPLGAAGREFSAAATPIPSSRDAVEEFNDEMSAVFGSAPSSHDGSSRGSVGEGTTARGANAEDAAGGVSRHGVFAAGSVGAGFEQHGGASADVLHVHIHLPADVRGAVTQVHVHVHRGGGQSSVDAIAPRKPLQ